MYSSYRFRKAFLGVLKQSTETEEVRQACTQKYMGRCLRLHDQLSSAIHKL